MAGGEPGADGLFHLVQCPKLSRICLGEAVLQGLDQIVVGFFLRVRAFGKEVLQLSDSVIVKILALGSGGAADLLGQSIRQFDCGGTYLVVPPILLLKKCFLH